jgi:hypothetical protein
MAAKDHKKKRNGQQAAPVASPAATPAAVAPKPAAVAVVGQANFTARIAVSPSIQKSRNLTADKLQVAIDEALQKFVNYDKTITVTVSQEK